MPVGVVSAGIGAAGAIGGALISSNSASNAASAQQYYDQLAIQEQQREYDTSRQDLMPWLTTGGSALDQLAAIYGLSTYKNGEVVPGSTKGGPDYSSFYKSPDYQFTMKQGIAGVDAGAAATGSLDSGATRKAEVQYAGNLASSQFNSYANRLAGLAGVGQTAGTSIGGFGQNTANQISQLYGNEGNNLASSYLAQGNIYSKLLGQLSGFGGAAYTNSGSSSPYQYAGSDSVPYVG